MENKKPLIIVPPMSEPMMKLKEILEGIAAEENIEIFTVEDAKEFTQLLGSGGQSLVMISNAKLCATLLQENKNIISKHHTKVILLTPKEIPIKTLEKFRKVGLTESILESTAPKTLLYKVKLQLKSIKITNKEDTSQQVIKTMMDSGPKMKLASDEMEITESKSADEINSSSDEVLKKIQKNEEENTLDYLGSLKGKKAKAEDQIETHWKSKRDNSNKEENSEEDMYSKPKVEAEEDFDMYYRGKLKKNELEIVEEQEDIYKKKSIVNEEETADYDLNRKKQEEELLPEAKRKKNLINEEETEDFYEKKEKREEDEQSPAEKRRKALIDEETAVDYVEKKNKVEDEEESEKERDLVKAEDLGGHYKGKLNTEQQDVLEEEYEDKKELIEDIAIEKNKKKTDSINEEDDIEKESKTKVLNEEDAHETGEGKVDHIDNYMRGDAETSAAIQTRMESETTKNKSHLTADESDDIKRKSNEDLSPSESNEKEKKLKLEEESENDFYQKAEIKTEDAEDHKNNTEKALALAEEDELERAKVKLEKEEDKDFKKKSDRNDFTESEFNQKYSEKINEEEKETRKSNSTNLDIEKSNEGSNHSSKADKISTYYKSGENNKKEQDWDLPQDKKSTTLEIIKAKQKENLISNSKKNNEDEVVIDYRKLKEEFEQISRDGLASHDENGNTVALKRGKNYSSEEEYQVIEIGPHAFDFSIDVLNLIYSNDIKANQILKVIAEKLYKEENAILITEQYKLSEKKYIETFNGMNDFNSTLSDDIKLICDEYIKNKFNTDIFHSYSMPLWMCQTIPDNDSFWKDYDLPSWAKNELSDKPVELIYPFFDGVDRMGFAYLLFPTGINPSNEKKIIIILEMLRSVFLDSVQRAKKNEPTTSTQSDEIDSKPAQSKIIGFFGNMFGKKKAG